MGVCRSVEQLTADYQKQIAELEERRDIEATTARCVKPSSSQRSSEAKTPQSRARQERQKHELALNLRSVEARGRSHKTCSRSFGDAGEEPQRTRTARGWLASP